MLRGVVTTIFGLFWAIVLVLTGARFLALLANANRDSELVSWLYRHSDFWVKPFFGMFDLTNKAVGDRGGVFEPASFIAFIVYFVAGLLVLAILNSSTGWYTNRRIAT
ncbi:MAG: hypothetical protein M3P30_09390 [Chloroflexota bacterium]|nr:hypothetical protein [Chloroflexota bacterium]